MSARRAGVRAAGALAALGVLVALSGCTGPDDGPEVQNEGFAAGYVSGDGSVTEWAPAERGVAVELSGITMAQDPVDIEDWRGEVVVLNFWYAACPPCRKEAPDLAAISREYAPDGVQFLGVNHTDEPATAQAFERRYDIPYPTLYDQGSAGVAAMQGVVPLNAVPTTVVLDRQGRVAARIVGIAEPGVLRPLIQDALAEDV